MLTKIETKSNRVKGLCFHPSRPWILASLHNGIIQLWDYRIKTLIDKFDEHEGPVRGVCFHHSQPLFVSGGDDFLIKVWNYKQRRCLYSLQGHLDYVRTVQFHPGDSPWVLSSSDDQTIRIWNWQSRQCVAVLTGHNHYVMCANFHPSEDMIVSASLDQAIRVWDISGLRNKTFKPKPYDPIAEQKARIQADIFGTSDAHIKYVLEGHERGVNWASFHPKSPLIVSGADDRQVKIWRMNEQKAWEADSFRGHFHNVSCAIFHPRLDIVISNSEDKTIRVWDLNKRAGIHTFRREHDRFWILSAHPKLNLFAAGHDSGMIVFKLYRERPSFQTVNNTWVYYATSKGIRKSDLSQKQASSSRDNPLLQFRRPHPIHLITSMHFSEGEMAVLVNNSSDGGHYELFFNPRADHSLDNCEGRRGSGIGAVFIGRKRFACLNGGEILIRDFTNNVIKTLPLPTPNEIPDTLFRGPSSGTLLLRYEDKISLYDIQQRKVLSELAVSHVKYCHWSSSENGGLGLKVAFLSKDTVIVANKNLQQEAVVHETIRVKSATWDASGVLIYCTLNHIKYLLPNGDSGVVRTLWTPVYITAMVGDCVHCLDRELKTRIIYINNSEYLFKLALLQKKYSTVMKMVQSADLIGSSIVSYLQKNGYPEVALYFVRDPQTRFDLAIECGNIEIAMEAAKQIDNNTLWKRLGIEALRQGNHQIVEMAYQRTKDPERLSFLYLITGNTDKLVKMLKIAEARQDIESRFHNTLFLGDVEERVNVLIHAQQYSLAYITARLHGLNEKVVSLENIMKIDPVADTENKESLFSQLNAIIDSHSACAQLMLPPTPIFQLHEMNWPLLSVSQDWNDVLAKKAKKEEATCKDEPGASTLLVMPEEEDVDVAAWGADELDLDNDGDIVIPSTPDDNYEGDLTLDEGDGWEIGDENDLEGLDQALEETEIKDRKMQYQQKRFQFPKRFLSAEEIWIRESSIFGDHAAAGSMESCMRLLHEQAGIINFEPLKSIILSIFQGSHCLLRILPGSPPLNIPLQRNGLEMLEYDPNASLPLVVGSLSSLVEKLKLAYKAMTTGAFNDSVTLFREIIFHILLVPVDRSNQQEIVELKELLGICREYLQGLLMELRRKDLSTKNIEPLRQLEMAAYFTHSNLQVPHLMLVLRSGMNFAYRKKNYITAAQFARRLIDLNPRPEIAAQAKKVIAFANTHNSNTFELNYDERNPFVICGYSHTPIYRGSPSVSCPFCKAEFLPEFDGKLCAICNLAKIGFVPARARFLA